MIEETLSKKLPSKLPLKAHLSTPKPIPNKKLPGLPWISHNLPESQSKIGNLPTWKWEMTIVGNECVRLNVIKFRLPKRDTLQNGIYSKQS